MPSPFTFLVCCKCSCLYQEHASHPLNACPAGGPHAPDSEVMLGAVIVHPSGLDLTKELEDSPERGPQPGWAVCAKCEALYSEMERFQFCYPQAIESGESPLFNDHRHTPQEVKYELELVYGNKPEPERYLFFRRCKGCACLYLDRRDKQVCASSYVKHTFESGRYRILKSDSK